VKSATEDASLGLDDDSVVTGREASVARASRCASEFGGRWFAEAYIEGREFNVSLLEENGGPRVLPIPELRFLHWPAEKPRIVGYASKWDDASTESENTVRAFGLMSGEPALARRLSELAVAAWTLFGLRGYARVDFRVDQAGNPLILELNPNPCIEPHAGFVAAAAEAGMSYDQVVEQILSTAR
jgi:D-alanine-D-alanine ligase